MESIKFVAASLKFAYEIVSMKQSMKRIFEPYFGKSNAYKELFKFLVAQFVPAFPVDMHVLSTGWEIVDEKLGAQKREKMQVESGGALFLFEHFEAYEPRYQFVSQASISVSLTLNGVLTARIIHIFPPGFLGFPRLQVEFHQDVVNGSSLMEVIQARLLPDPTQRQLDGCLANMHNAVKLRQPAEQVQEYIQQFLQYAPDHPRALLYLGITFLATRDYDKAEQILTSSLSLGIEERWLQEVYYNFSLVYQGRGDISKALVWMQRAHVQDPKNHVILFGLAELFDQQGDVNRAVAYYTECLAQSPNPGGVWSYRGRDFTSQATKRLNFLTS